MRIHLADFTLASPRSTLVASAPGAAAMLAAMELPMGEIPWWGVLVIEGVETGDERIFSENAITWAELPMPLTDNHDMDHIIGRVDEITREGNTIMGRGVFDDSDAGREAARQVAARLRRGLSVDVDDVDGEITIEQAHDPEGGGVDPEDDIIVIPIGNDLMTLTAARIRGVALATIAAFVETQITLDGPAGEAVPVEVPEEAVAASAEHACSCGTAVTAGGTVTTLWVNGEPMPYAALPSFNSADSVMVNITAAAPVARPAAWFDDPRLGGPTPLTVTEDGRVFGHLAAPWGSCHTGITDRCVMPPRSAAGYAYFTTGSILTADGSQRRVGQLTMGTGHAPLSFDHRAAAAHYDGGHGALQWADVAVGEDSHGVWVAGAVRPGLSDAQLREARALALSGDWRSIGGHLELVAALSVPVPGFPVVPLAASAHRAPDAPRARIDHGTTLALVAAGVVVPPPPWQAAVDALRHEVMGELAILRRNAEVLAPLAAEGLLASLREGNASGTT